MTQRDNFFAIDDAGTGERRTLGEGLEARFFEGEQAMISLVLAAPFAQGSVHKHPEEQWGFLLRGSGTRIQGEEAFSVRVGDFWRTPSNVPHGFHAGEEGALIIDFFSPPRKDYRRP